MNKDESLKQEPVRAWFTADEFVEMADRRIKEWAKQEQGEPVAWMAENKAGNVRFTNIGESADQLESYGWAVTPLYTAHFQLQPLTGEDILECWKQVYEPGRREYDNATRMARVIEAKLKEKNT